jgi:hypothetical protein
MTSSATWRRGERIMRGVPNKRRWACPDPGCTQERITSLDVKKGPTCPLHRRKMTKRRKVVR